MALVGMDFQAPLREVKRVQFGVLSPDEIVRFYAKFLNNIRFLPATNVRRRDHVCRGLRKR